MRRMQFTRRQLLGAATATAAVACIGRRPRVHEDLPPRTLLRPLSSESARARTDRRLFPRGYLLAQDLSTYNTSRFGAISTEREATALFDNIAGRVDGLEYISLFFDDSDMRVHESVARLGVARGVDLWMSTFRLVQNAHAFGPIPGEFQAHVMTDDGRIVPATMRSEARELPILDVLNPEATDWFVHTLERRYLTRMKGLVAGLFFNEDCVTYLGKPKNNRRYDYWRNAAYSPHILLLWRDYCRNAGVTLDGKLVDRFPVHDASMAANGAGATVHVPGWNVPEQIAPGQRFAALERTTGVWKHWDDFVCTQFRDNWLSRLARVTRDVNQGESRWRGVIYFGLHDWSLPYEEIENQAFAVPEIQQWGAWGRQRGVDLVKIAQDSEIDCIICETYPPVAANLELFINEYARITRAAGKSFGVMLHRDDSWPLDPTEEDRRWELINKFQPDVIARYPLTHMLSGNRYFSAQGEATFQSRLKQFRQQT